MQPDRFARPPEAGPTVGTVTMVFAAIGCFTVGFMALMAFPRLWPRYVAAPDMAGVQPAGPAIVGQTPPRPGIAHVAAAGVVTEIKPTIDRPIPQTLGGTAVLGAGQIGKGQLGAGALASLAECKAAMRAGLPFNGVESAGMAAMLGSRGQQLTTAQVDAGCRRMTEKLTEPPPPRVPPGKSASASHAGT